MAGPGTPLRQQALRQSVDGQRVSHAAQHGLGVARTIAAIETAHAAGGGLLVLSHDDSAWHAEHLFAVDKEVPGADMVRLSGDFLTHVFEGPYKEAPTWAATMAVYVKERGKHLDTMYFFYTTCPKCARHYGKNYVVGVAKVSPLEA